MNTLAYVGFACFVAAVTIFSRRRGGPGLVFVPAALVLVGSGLIFADVLLFAFAVPASARP
jgi:hypothetical protein